MLDDHDRLTWMSGTVWLIPKHDRALFCSSAGGTDDRLVLHRFGGVRGTDLTLAVKQAQIVFHSQDAFDGLVQLLLGNFAVLDKPLQFAIALIAELVFRLVRIRSQRALKATHTTSDTYFHKRPC